MGALSETVHGNRTRLLLGMALNTMALESGVTDVTQHVREISSGIAYNMCTLMHPQGGVMAALDMR